MLGLDTYRISTVDQVTEKDLHFLNLSGRQIYYNQGYYGQGVVVAVLDTGVSLHPEFEDRLLPGANCISSYPKDLGSTDDHGHGTHVAGSIAGKTCGIAPKAKILPVKVLDALGFGNVDDMIRGLEYVLNWRGPDGERVDIVNMSLSGPASAYKGDKLQRFHDAIKKLVDAGIAVIVAAGNTGKEEVRYPAYFWEVIAVGAVDQSKKTAMFSTRSNEVDVSQVGTDVLSCNYTGGYVKYSGTSMATPIVSGIAALIASKYKALFGSYMPEPVIYEMLKMNTVDLGLEGVDIETGAGFCTLNPRPISMLIKPGSDTVIVNGETVKIDPPTMIIDNRTMVPLRSLVDLLFATVDYDPIAKTGKIEI